MGYSIDYTGELKFNRELTGSELAKVKKWLGEDIRDHNPSTAIAGYWHHIDLELLEDFSGLKWDGSEKSGEMQYIVNFLVDEVRADGVSDFGLTGVMDAQGEEIGDVWRLEFDADGVAQRRDVIVLSGSVCPECGHEFTPTTP